MFHDPCPLIWPTQKKMNIRTLVTRLTFSWHAALFRGQSIKSNQRLQKSFSPALTRLSRFQRSARGALLDQMRLSAAHMLMPV